MGRGAPTDKTDKQGGGDVEIASSDFEEGADDLSKPTPGVGGHQKKTPAGL